MTSEYQVQTARTAKVPPFLAFDNHSEPEWKPATYAPTANQYSDATGLVQHLSSYTLPTELLLAIKIPNSYPQIPSITLGNPTGRSPTPFKVPHHGLAQIHEVITRHYEAASLSRVVLRSSATEPTGNTVTSLLTSNADSTGAIPGLLIVTGIAHAIVAKEADEWIAKAREAARAGDLRAAYHGIYRGLDVLMKTAKWERVSAELEEICSGSYPIAFGIGAMRFVSKAAERIPNWNVILKSLMQTAQRETVDVRKAFRGLVETNGAK